MAAIRVMLGRMPAMLRGILEETFAAQGDMMLVGLTDSASSSVSRRAVPAQCSVCTDRNVDGGAAAIGHALLASQNAYKI